jgi:biopolymer transport protein ExbB
MENNMGFFTWLTTAFAEGGVWMWVIAIVHVATVAIVIDRVYALYMKRADNQTDVIKSFEEDIKSGQLDRTLDKAKMLRREEPIAAVVAAGTQAARDLGGRDEIQARMDEILTVENSRLETRTGYLAMLANVATLLGLLGTIVGLIQAFASVSNVDAAQKALLLTRGVALAMNTTAYGLIVAIPTLIVHSVLMNRTVSLQEDLNQSAFKVFNWLNFNFESVSTKPQRPKRTV